MNVPKILLVDDTRFFLEVEKSLLAVSPVHILTAADGEEALQIIRAEHPDIIIMDIVMPKLDGKKCCAAVKADPDLRSIPIIMVTTSDQLADIRACFDAGCNDFITKPLNRKHFLEKVRRFLPIIDRRQVRKNCAFQVELQFDGTTAMVECHDISHEGMFIKSTLKLTLGSPVNLSFTLPDVAARITARAHIAWQNDGTIKSHNKMPAGFGIEIEEITGEGLSSLRKKEYMSFVDNRNK
jgi:CheY-like chemotaxis protein/Tfp pilus assembly protein PilZ